MASIAADLVVTHLDALVSPVGPAPLAGAHQGRVDALRDAAFASRDGRLVFVGTAAACRSQVTLLPGGRALDGRGCTAVPGLVDPHTHAVFAGDRRNELRRRLAGATYAEIARSGGGIVGTVAATRAASEDTLVEAALPRLAEMLRCGTTTCEVKSGYGLEFDAELRMLGAIRHLQSRQPVELVPTFMGAHEVPVEWRHDAEGYLARVVEEMIPAVAAAGLAEWCDVFCETGVFTPEQSERVLRAGAAHGLRPRIHADELGPSGGSQVAARVGARSADHLVHVDADGIAALATGRVCATLLPIAAFYLKLGRFAPARDLIAAGVPVALATDVNPGGGLSPSMPFAMALACFGMGMTLEEALVAATLNAAWSVDRDGMLGSLEVGKQCDAVLVRGGLVDLLRVGTAAIGHVVAGGTVAVGVAATA
jgi:imidazolonepropionase